MLSTMDSLCKNILFRYPHNLYNLLASLQRKKLKMNVVDKKKILEKENITKRNVTTIY